jgi:hypothetical protein
MVEEGIALRRVPIDTNLPDRIGRCVLRSEDPVSKMSVVCQLTSGLK